MAGKKKGRFFLRMFGTWQVTQERFQSLEVIVSVQEYRREG
ncbi:MAG: hypothetical protein ACXADH_17280 [Candidatus Kariarchaeaceae archaeon]|jgi:hypothetical protein